MGIQRMIRFPQGQTPTWVAIQTNLNSLTVSAVLRMIDGLPAFPNEEPEPTWQELRVSLNGDMVTLRKAATEMIVVAWGNVSSSGIHAYDCLTWAVAKASQGRIHEGNAEYSFEDFAKLKGFKSP